MTDPRRVLVVGSYPPIPLPSSGATVEAVRRAWEDGLEVTVVSHRSSAADLSVPVIGPLAGHRLDRLRRSTDAARLVLVVEDGAPVPDAPAPLQRVSARELARSMRRFDHVTVVTAGAGTLSPGARRTLLGVADDLVVHPVGRPAPGVTAAGPREFTFAQRSRWVLARAGRKLLGSRAPLVRARLSTFRRTLGGIRRDPGT